MAQLVDWLNTVTRIVIDCCRQGCSGAAIWVIRLDGRESQLRSCSHHLAASIKTLLRLNPGFDEVKVIEVIVR